MNRILFFLFLLNVLGLICMYAYMVHIIMILQIIIQLQLIIIIGSAKHTGKDHHHNQDGIGDDKDQHKGKTDDAKQFGLFQFVVLLLGESLRWGREGRNPVGTFK